MENFPEGDLIPSENSLICEFENDLNTNYNRQIKIIDQSSTTDERYETFVKHIDEIIKEYNKNDNIRTYIYS